MLFTGQWRRAPKFTKIAAECEAASQSGNGTAITVARPDLGKYPIMDEIMDERAIEVTRLIG